MNPLILVILLLCSVFFNIALSSDQLPIYVFELRPLIYRDGDEVKGEWYKSFEKLSKKAKIKFKYEFTSIPRLEILLGSERPGCSLTLLKTPTRVNKMKINFIHDHEEKTIFKVYQRASDTRKWTLKSLQEDKTINLITNTGVAVDVLKEKNIKSELLFNINSIIHMLLIKRVDIFVGSNLAIEETEEFKKGLIKAGLELRTLIHGIGCSRGTSSRTILNLKKSAKNWKL